MFRFLFFTLALALTLVVFIFTLENLELIEINFLIFQIQVPLGIVMLICFILGAIIGIVFSISLALKNKAHAKKLAKKVRVAEQEVANLRQLPIKSSH